MTTMEWRSGGCLKTSWLIWLGMHSFGQCLPKGIPRHRKPEGGNSSEKLLLSTKCACMQVRLPAHAIYEYPWVTPHRPWFLPQMPRLKQEITLDFGLQ